MPDDVDEEFLPDKINNNGYYVVSFSTFSNSAIILQFKFCVCKVQGDVKLKPSLRGYSHYSWTFQKISDTCENIRWLFMN